MTPEEINNLKWKVDEKIAECNKKSFKKYNVMVHPVVIYNLTGNTAGIAQGNGNMKLNLPLLIEYKEKFINQTVVHEMAHLIVYKIYGFERSRSGRRKVKPHGKEWKRVMRTLGIFNPKTYHEYDVDSAMKKAGVKTRSKVQKPHHYKCSKDCKWEDHYVSNIIHKRMMVFGQTRICNCCKQKLTYIGS